MTKCQELILGSQYRGSKRILAILEHPDSKKVMVWDESPETQSSLLDSNDWYWFLVDRDKQVILQEGTGERDAAGILARMHELNHPG